MIVVETNTPMHGAAYQVLYERLNPVGIVTPEQLMKARQDMGEIIRWASEQDPDVAAAYGWACAKMGDQLKKQFAHYDLANKVRSAYQTIPRPSFSIKGEKQEAPAPQQAFGGFAAATPEDDGA